MSSVVQFLRIKKCQLSTSVTFTAFSPLLRPPPPLFSFSSIVTPVQDERGFNEFSFDEFEKKLAEEEATAAAAAAGELNSEEGEEADMFG